MSTRRSNLIVRTTTVSLVAAAAFAIGLAGPAAQAQGLPSTPYAGPCVPPSGFGANNTVAKVPALIVNIPTARTWQADFLSGENAFNADLISMPPGGSFSGACIKMGIFSAAWNATVNFHLPNGHPSIPNEVVGFLGVEITTGGGTQMCMSQKPLTTASITPQFERAVANGTVTGQIPTAVRVDMRNDLLADNAKISRVTFGIECGGQ